MHCDEDTILADKTDYVREPEWYHERFFDIPKCISSSVIETISVNKNYFKVTPLTTDTTPLNYKTMFHDRTIDISLKSTILHSKKT